MTTLSSFPTCDSPITVDKADDKVETRKIISIDNYRILLPLSSINTQDISHIDNLHLTTFKITNIQVNLSLYRILV